MLPVCIHTVAEYRGVYISMANGRERRVCMPTVEEYRGGLSCGGEIVHHYKRNNTKPNEQLKKLLNTGKIEREREREGIICFYIMPNTVM